MNCSTLMEGPALLVGVPSRDCGWWEAGCEPLPPRAVESAAAAAAVPMVRPAPLRVLTMLCDSLCCAQEFGCP